MRLPHSTLWSRFGARPQCGFRILPQRTPRGKRRKANMITQKRTLPRRRLRSLRPFVSPSGSPPENAQSRNEPAKSDNRTATRERANGDLDPRRNRNVSFRKPSCLARASNSRRERTQNTRAETQGLPIRTHDSRKTNADARINLSGGRTEPLPALQKCSHCGRKF